ncbi:restriction endonuclease subunit S [Cohnella yongneupensis]|uniref:Restriction endonuclease subunit S n=1 Tax=Cohnella yongneupensis TaxID=425006 RepID=A0ABW0R1A3_9BACL
MSIKSYTKYKDSNTVWLRNVPEHWEVKRLGYFFEERREKVNDVDYQPLSVTKNGIVPQLVTAAKTDDGDNRKKVCKGDFVINSRSDRKGSSGAATLDGSVSLINIVLKPRDEIKIDFAHHLFRSQPFQDEFYRFGKGIVADLWSTIYSDMRNITLAIPPHMEQDSIAEYLYRETEKIDALVSEQERLIALLKEKRQAVISHSVTKGLDPTAPLKDSGIDWLGNVPSHWEIKSLKFIANVQTGIAKGKDISGKSTIEVPYLRVANVQDGYLDLSDVATITIPIADYSRYALCYGDVLMNEGGDFDKLGRGHIWRDEISQCIHQNHVFAVRPMSVSSEWLNTITGSGYAQFYFMTRSKQSTNLASISSSNIMELPILLPSIAEQIEILTYITKETRKVDDLINNSQRSISLLKERRNALITAAVTGKIDVRGL